MAINVRTNADEEETSVGFPKLMTNKHGAILLATKSVRQNVYSGFLLKSVAGNTIGFYEEMHDFFDFNGEVTISNKL